MHRVPTAGPRQERVLRRSTTRFISASAANATYRLADTIGPNLSTSGGKNNIKEQSRRSVPQHRI